MVVVFRCFSKLILRFSRRNFREIDGIVRLWERFRRPRPHTAIRPPKPQHFRVSVRGAMIEHFSQNTESTSGILTIDAEANLAEPIDLKG